MLAGLMGLCVVVTWSTMSNIRTISIQATTWGGEITFKGQLNDWVVEKGTICRLLLTPNFRAKQPDTSGPCSLSLYNREVVEDAVIDWSADTTIRFTRNGQGEFVVQTLAGNTAGLPEGSLIVIPADTWRGHGALTFQGVARLGGAIASGSKDYLIGGTWEAHQSGLATSFFRDVTEVVKSGSFKLGAAVDLVSETPDVLSYGHITPAPEDESGVGVALLSERGPVAVRIKHYGLSKAAVFRPDWIDTLSSSPMLVALAVLFSFLLAAIQIFSLVPTGRTRDR